MLFRDFSPGILVMESRYRRCSTQPENQAPSSSPSEPTESEFVPWKTADSRRSSDRHATCNSHRNRLSPFDKMAHCMRRFDRYGDGNTSYIWASICPAMGGSASMSELPSHLCRRHNDATSPTVGRALVSDKSLS
ncbi:hypothetical protein PINS_up020183 [Pythium insidiosum]|nr:hypothetical protein PINS_up020183 [Pythium insidiosum]